MITSKSTDSSSICYLLNVRALTPLVCPCSRFLSISVYHYGTFYHLLRKGKPKIHILDCCSFVSYFVFWRELFFIPNSNISETVHQHEACNCKGEEPVLKKSAHIVCDSFCMHTEAICKLILFILLKFTSMPPISMIGMSQSSISLEFRNDNAKLKRDKKEPKI